MKVHLREKKLKNGGRSLYLEFYSKGKREFEFLSLYLTGDKRADKETLALAQKIRTNREYEINHNNYGFRNKYKSDIEFLEYFETIRNSKTTQAGVWKSTKFHLEYFIGKKSVKLFDITNNWLEDFKAYLIVQVQSGTARGYFACIRQTLKQALIDELINKNPCDQVNNFKQANTKRAYLSIEELKKLNNIACSNQEVKRAFLFSCYTGLRISDIRSLKWSHLHNNQLEIIQKKTKEPVFIPLNKTALKLLLNNGIDEKDSLVFNVPSDTYLSVIMKTWIEQAQISKKITFHSARHTFATLALTSGVDIYTVSKLLGHTRLETTQVYAKIIDNTKSQAVQQLPDLYQE